MGLRSATRAHGAAVLVFSVAVSFYARLASHQEDSMTSARKRLAGGLLLASIFFFFFCSVNDAHAIPAFARKYGLRCSACHEAWPMLNYFGQKFKYNGYQLMNDRDAPIWQNPSYWPVTFRITPYWHRESSNKVQVD